MIDKQIFKLQGVRQVFLQLIFVSLVSGILIIIQTVFLTDALIKIWLQKNSSAWFLSVLFFLFAFASRQLINYFRDQVTNGFSSTQTSTLKKMIDQKLYEQGPDLLNEKGSGSLLTLDYEGIDQVKTYLQNILSRSSDMFVIPWIILIYVIYENWLSGLILFLVFPLIIFFMAILGIAAQKKSDQQYAGFELLNNHFVDSIRGLETLKMLGVSQRYGRSVVSVSENYRRKTMRVLRVAFTSSFALDFFTTLSIAIEAVMLGLALINGQVALTAALSVLIISPDYFLPLRQFGEDYHANLNGKNALHRIFALLAKPAPVVAEMNDFIWSDHTSLTVKNLNFTYENAANKALTNVNFKLTAFSKIAIIGSSGSGKTTLLNLLAGFLQTDSSENPSFVLNGQRINGLNAHAWQRQIGYIPQDPYIFSASIAENIAFYRPESSLAEIEKISERVGLTSFLDQLPDGLNTRIGEAQRGISGGQMQRIALARTLLDQKRKILLFDEPTAHLDIESEYALKQTIQPLMKDHLVIFATHRLHWLEQMDWILVLKDGRLVEQGSLTDLKNADGEFSELLAKMASERQLHESKND